MSLQFGSIMHCGNCNGLITAENLMTNRICPFCGSDLLESLCEFNRQINQPPSGPALENLRIAQIFLTNKLWERALGAAQMAIMIDPYDCHCYLYRLLAEMEASTIVELAYVKESFADRASYLMFRRHAPQFLRIEVDYYLKIAQDRLAHRSHVILDWDDDPPDGFHADFRDEHEDSCDDSETYSSYEDIYRHACQVHHCAVTYRDFKDAAELFESIPHYKDSDARSVVCNRMYSTHRSETFMANFLKGGLLFSFFLVALRVVAGIM